MNSWKGTVAFITIVLALGTGLAACGTVTEPGKPGFLIDQVTVPLKDGRTVTCLTYKTSLDCDWDHVK